MSTDRVPEPAPPQRARLSFTYITERKQLVRDWLAPVRSLGHTDRARAQDGEL